MLREPFDPDNEIEWRVQRVHSGGTSASLIAYVTARAVMDRLDLVFGVDGYSVEYRTIELGKHAGFMCRITAGGVTKEDISDLTDVEPLKGGVSGALKRCAVLFGIGRYLYDLGEEFAKVESGRGPKGSISVKKPDGSYGFVLRPKMPEWARPKSKPPGGAMQAAREQVAAGTRKDAPEGSAGRVDPVPDAPHDPEWTSGGNRAFMAKYSANFPADEGYDYDMLADFLESIGKQRPSQMPKEKREQLLGWLLGKGRAQFSKYVNDIIESRQTLQ